MGPSIFQKNSSVSRANDRLARNFVHTERAMFNIWSYRDFFSILPPPTKKGRPLFVCSICIMANGMIARKKVLCGERFTNRPSLKVSHYMVGVTPWNFNTCISCLPPVHASRVVVRPATLNMPSVENSLFEHFVTLLSRCIMLTMVIMVCFEKLR